jgi:hypothetical protein
LQDFLKFTQIDIFGLKIYHLATLAATTPARPLTMRKKTIIGKNWPNLHKC